MTRTILTVFRHDVEIDHYDAYTRDVAGQRIPCHCKIRYELSRSKATADRQKKLTLPEITAL